MRYQLKIALSYLSLLTLMLILVNTYPVYNSQSLMFDNARTTMSARASLLANTLSGNLTAESVGRIMAALDDQKQYRTVVCDRDGLVVYDNLSTGAVTGRYALVPELTGALSGSDVFHSVYKDAAFDSRYAMPIISHGEVSGALYLSRYDTDQGATLYGMQSAMLTASLVIFGSVLVFSVFISLALTRRIAGILRGIRAAQGGNYAYELPVGGGDELSEVSGLLNQLFTVLRRTEGLRQQFVSNASHELKTPLAAVRLLTDSILGTPDMPVETIRDFVADIGEETERLGRMTEKLMNLSRLDSRPEDTYTLDTAPVIRRAAHMLGPLAAGAGVELRCELSENCFIRGSEDDLYQLVFNLMDNAIKYSAEGGTARVFSFPLGGEVRLVVADNGVGIPEHELPFIFDRFYRVDKARSRAAGGAGLGLSIAAQTAARMGGSISVDSTPGKGSEFTVVFPAARKEGEDV